MKKKKILIASVLAAAIASSGVIAGTYAYFSATKEAPSSVKMAKVDLDVSFKETTLEVYSMGAKQEGSIFENGGEASFKDFVIEGKTVKGLSLDRICPGDSVKFSLSLDNKSNIAIKYRVAISIPGEEDCPLQLEGASSWARVDVGGEIPEQQIEILLPKTAGNAYQNKSYEVLINVEAIQANAIED